MARYNQTYASTNGSYEYPMKEIKSDKKSSVRKITSLSYLRQKARAFFHRNNRDTFVVDHEEDDFDNRYRHGIIGLDELIDTKSPTSTKNDVRSSRGTRYTASFDSVQEFTELSRRQPSQDRRFCVNCSKCFQRPTSQFDYYCGLDCKTSHRFRQ